MVVFNQLQFLSKEFNLQLIPQIYQHIELTTREFVIMHFLSGCPLYQQYGNQDNGKKIINLEIFMKTNYFTKYCERKLYGSVFYIETITENYPQISLISDKLIQNEILSLFNKLKNKFSLFGLACITSDVIKIKENNHILLHEFIHILLRSNNLNVEFYCNLFQKYNLKEMSLVDFWKFIIKNKIVS